MATTTAPRWRCPLRTTAPFVITSHVMSTYIIGVPGVALTTDHVTGKVSLVSGIPITEYRRCRKRACCRRSSPISASMPHQYRRCWSCKLRAEFAAKARQWITAVGAGTAYIERGIPERTATSRASMLPARRAPQRRELYSLCEAQIVIES